ncbi:alkaline phosphatase D family protein [Phenylobacterium sp.]|uniref:alkaline phosphatase D family protein n=1 Tax=Phenylobacterium sp. TaxID=1871053 RepID=UPI0012030D04|nr:alkaline phosphatase D family protein [Phenylobacterium sp.]THD60095.1 MAG: phosphodiesterase [Phenylobacterium sp.]
MSLSNRRAFIASAAALGAAAAWARPVAARSRRPWTERRDLYPQGVASGDPEPSSVILWTRRPYADERGQAVLQVEVAEDEAFDKVVARSRVSIAEASDWTGRVLVGGLQPHRVYWYRFTDSDGAGSRIGRTITAPELEDPGPTRFAFVSCQSVNEGAQNAFRRMIWEDRRAAPDQRLGFVLHLGDFIYEVVEYPDEVAHRYDRTVYNIGRIPEARKVDNFHVPTTLDGYRMVYRAHINDPDIQDARAYFPFVCIGDNHEFSWQGWQTIIKYDGKAEPAQKLRVAANQAWWEYIPSRVRKSSGPKLDRFDGPTVENAPILQVDQDGLGDEPNNHAALASMTAYRAMRYGRHLELILSDLHSYTMEDPSSRNEADAFDDKTFPTLMPLEVLEILDAGRSYNSGNPPPSIRVGDKSVENFARNDPPFTVLGREQKAWLKHTLAASKATWKVWGATNGTLDMRADPQNLPQGLTAPWPGQGYACFGSGDFSGALNERAELYDFVRDAGVSGFAIVSGDRHSFWAGYAAKALPPKTFEPVGVAFICGSISAPGMAEAVEHGMKGHPLRSLFVSERETGKPEATINLTLKHGVRSALEYAKTGDLAAAHRMSNPENAPHLEFVDMGGHGYAVITASQAALQSDFVCIPRPITRATTPDGGPLRYRVRHTAAAWRPGERPKLDQQVIEGDPGLSV